MSAYWGGVYTSENRIEIKRFDEEILDTLVEGDIDFPWICVCGKRCAKTETFNGETFEALDCDWLVVIDRKHWRPICRDCFATFETRSTAEGLFRL
jgi:hypothetical protein